MERILRNTSAIISQTFYNGETAVEADSPVTVVAKKADGTTLFSVTATNDPGVGIYTVVIPPQANLNILTLTWTGTFSSTVVSLESTVEIVGGFYFSIAELRGFDSIFSNIVKYTNDALVNARNQVESEFEDICHRAFVPRFYRETGVITDPDEDMIWLEKPELIKILTFKVNNIDYSSWYGSGYFARDKYSPRGIHVYNSALGLFAFNPDYYPDAIVAEYEYGMTQVPLPIKQKALKRARMLLVGQNSTIDERALTMSLPDIGTVNLATPGMRGAETGVPDIDVVLRRYTIDGGAGVF